MQPGDVIAERFEVVALAGSGGMGVVFRARDRLDGGLVAVKVLLDPTAMHRDRFAAEARVLTGLHHTGISRYVAHGALPDGRPYLVMEWLEGEDLAARLRREPLRTGEVVAIVRAVTEVLAVTHAEGVVHRDIKPGNIFLVKGPPQRVVLVDFGIAHLGHQTVASTRTGMLLGTPGYLAPEQARGERGVDGRADFFSLGCVLHECLTGAPPFAAEHAVAVLAKILLDPAPPLGESRPDLAGPLEVLLGRLLAKAPAGRPVDAKALLGELDALPPLGDAATPERPRPLAQLTSGELRLCSVVLAGAPGAVRPSSDATVMSTGDDAPTSASSQEPRIDPARLATLTAAVTRFGGQLEVLGDRALVVNIAGSGVATDQAAKAARCALALRALLPDLPVALATGRGVVSDRWPLGEVIDRAAAMLASSAMRAYPTRIRVDALTAGLLGAGFELLAEPGEVHWLCAEHAAGARLAARLLLGKPTPYVGRERELARLLGVVQESVDEPAARAVLVTAAPGVGKSRLRDELQKRLPAELPGLATWVARGDPSRAGAPFSLLAPLVRAAAGILEGAPAGGHRAALQARVALRLPEADRARVAAFLSELCADPWDATAYPPLAAARQDPQLMNDQLRRAFAEWLAAEVRAQPILLILDDLHWGDVPSVRHLDAALRALHDQPLCVLALARPNVHDLFPALWAERGVEELRLRELAPRAAGQLVRAVLGALPEADVARLVELADGNAFHLEELIRAAAQGAALPETVVAMLQARFEALDEPSRRLLRVASLFGRRFTRAGVAALTGFSAHDLAQALKRLEERELVEPAPGGLLQFRHALLQEAARAMMPAPDAQRGHRLAAAWLEQNGEQDPLLLADHLDRAGELGRAAVHYARASEAALRASDLDAALHRARRGKEGATGELLGELCALEAEALLARGELEEVGPVADVAIAECTRGTERWYRAVAAAAESWGRRGESPRLVALGSELLAEGLAEASPSSFAGAAVRVAWQLIVHGQRALGDALVDKLLALAAPGDVRFESAVQEAGATQAMLTGDVERWAACEAASAVAFFAAGDVRRGVQAQMQAGYALTHLGEWHEAERVLRGSADYAARLGLPVALASSLQNLGNVLATLGRHDEAEAAFADALARFKKAGDARMESGTHLYRAMMLERMGRLDEARAALDAAADGLTHSPMLQAVLQSQRSRVALRQGDAALADTLAREAGDHLEREGAEMGEVFIWMAVIEAADAVGDRDRAVAAAERARARLRVQADKIQSPERRRLFLTAVPENAELAAWKPRS